MVDLQMFTVLAVKMKGVKTAVFSPNMGLLGGEIAPNRLFRMGETAVLEQKPAFFRGLARQFSGLAVRVLLGDHAIAEFCCMNLNQKQLQLIEELAGCHYSPKDIATYLGISTELFCKAWAQKDSAIRESYDRGRLIAQAEIDMATLRSAKGGNLTAAQIWAGRHKDQHLENLKKEILFHG